MDSSEMNIRHLTRQTQSKNQLPADAEAFEFFAALGQKSTQPAGVWLPARRQ
jgi:hypothetical protein